MSSSGRRDSLKSRYPKLRASCDTCFLAKVKCSKARPICSRCLACGSDCNYSPSTRHGKPKSDGTKSKRLSLTRGAILPEDTKPIVYGTSISMDTERSTQYGMETHWCGSPDGMMHRRPIHQDFVPNIVDENSSEAESSVNAEIFEFAWTSPPQNDISHSYIENIHARTKSVSQINTPPSLSSSWFDPSESPSHFLNPIHGYGPNQNIYMHTSNVQPTTPACNCFNTCLQALQALHNSDALTSASPFDIVLTVNQRAVETCATMLNCPICMSRANSSSCMMLLGTILGKIISVYQGASTKYFDLSSGPLSHQNLPLPLTFGTYRVSSEDVGWIQMEIILRDLKKLKEVFAKFRDISTKSDSEDDAGMRVALADYLGQNLEFTFTSLKKQKSFGSTK